MIKTKIELKKMLTTEQKFYNPSFFGQLLSLFGVSEKNIIWRYQKNLRKWEYHLNTKHKLLAFLYKFKTTRIGYKYGFSIPPNCFDCGLHIMHLGSIIVNSNSKIGINCTLNINTAIVATNGNSGSAIIGDNCKMGVGSTIVGEITLGNNVAIGAGAVVTKSFKINQITIAGCPAKIISNKGLL